MINIVIPMAGLGSRFSDAGYEKPKPFIDVLGKPMIERVMDNLNIEDSNFILLVREEHIRDYQKYIKSLSTKYKSTIFTISELTQGTACTVLLARELINNDMPLIIANSDQIVDIDLNEYVQDALKKELDGSILTFSNPEMDPKWSFAKLNNEGLVTKVKEKVAISSNATVGIYLFKKGRDFVEGAIDMILQQDTVNGEYYTCPVYNYLIKKNLKIGIFEILESQMHGIGTPSDLDNYLNLRE